MPRAIMPGTFDPLTNGHLDLIFRAYRTFGDLVVAVGENVRKNPRFSAAEREQLVRASCGEIPELAAALARDELRVVRYGGLLVDCARQNGASVIVKGLRGHGDLDAEMVQAAYNRDLADLETLFLPGVQRWQHVSSSAVRELLILGADPSPYVPGPVLAALTSQKTN